MGGSVFRRSAAAPRRRGEAGQGFEVEIFRDQIAVLAQAVAGAFDLDDDGVMQQRIEERGGNDGMAEELAPFGEAAV